MISLTDFRLMYIHNGAEPHEAARTISAFLHAGGRWVQLRMKTASTAQRIELTKVILPLCQSVKATLIMDDDVEAALAGNTHGVHLGKQDMPLLQARKILGPQAIIGTTANTLQDMLEQVAQGANYIGLGPFRFTTTKSNLSPILGLQGYQEIMLKFRQVYPHFPVCAIGGIQARHIQEIIQTGISGIAISSAISPQPNPEEATQTLHQHLALSVQHNH